MRGAIRLSTISAFLALTIGFQFDCTSSAWADGPPPSAEAVVKAIESAAIFPPTQKLQAKVNGVEALISTYKDKGSKDSDNDSKIHSVLAARELFNKFPDLVRVKVKFYDPLKLNSSDTISVTVGDVSSFSSGQTSTAKLLASLEVRHEQESAAPLNMRASTSSKSSVVKSSASVYSTSSNSKFMPISAAGAPTDLVFYIQRDLGMKLAYPKGWILAEKPAADTLLSLSSTSEDGQSAVVLMYANQRIPGATIEQSARLTFDTYLRPTMGAKLHATKAVRFGKDGCIEGICQELVLPIDKVLSRATFYYFFDGNKFILVQCIAAENFFAKVEPSFNSILLSIVPGAVRAASQAASRSTSSTTSTVSPTQASRDGLIVYNAGSSGVTFSYPSSWKAQPPPDAKTIVKLTGQGPQNKYGELSLVSEDFPHPEMLEIYANNVGEHMVQSLKDGRKISSAHVSAHGRDILRETISFSQNGQTSTLQFGYFCHEGKIFTFGLGGAGWAQSESQVFFDRILSSVSAH